MKIQAMADNLKWLMSIEEEAQEMRVEHNKWLAFIDAKGGICGARQEQALSANKKSFTKVGDARPVGLLLKVCLVSRLVTPAVRYKHDERQLRLRGASVHQGMR